MPETRKRTGNGRIQKGGFTMNKEWEELIDRYIQRDLSEKDWEQFELLIQTEPEFAKQLELMQHISTSIDQLNKEKAMPKKKPSYKFILSLSVAAAVLLLVYWVLPPKYSSAQLFEQYYMAKEYEDTGHRGGDEWLNNDQIRETKKAISFYQQKEYQLAATTFEQATRGIAIENLPKEISFYAALSEAEIKQIDKAILKLEYLTVQGDIYKNDAQWYLALLYLQQGERNKAFDLLQELQKKNSLYQDKVEELIKQIKQKKWL